MDSLTTSALRDLYRGRFGSDPERLAALPGDASGRRLFRVHGAAGPAIGVHGPIRGYTGPVSTKIDWTLGCIAVGTDAEIARVAEWVRASKARRIIIRG